MNSFQLIDKQYNNQAKFKQLTNKNFAEHCAKKKKTLSILHTKSLSLSLCVSLSLSLSFHCNVIVYLKLLQPAGCHMWGHCVKHEWQNKAIKCIIHACTHTHTHINKCIHMHTQCTYVCISVCRTTRQDKERKAAGSVSSGAASTAENAGSRDKQQYCIE